ncbi:DUF1553 domain-containing protein [Emticicia soli]|uniref:DUF1553 domain-containing protein n=1 Tax=Emticicia soli TaxID=2027878 RepID=A0ABW5J7R3_9BACT
MRIRFFIISALIVATLSIGWSYFNDGSADTVDYSTQVKPILNKHCISCHGGVKKQGDFSLLFRSEALATAKSGKPAIIPFHPEQSEFIKRLTHTDPDERMPYKAAQLSQEDIAILTQWVKEGAKWGDHWAYVAPKDVKVPNKGIFAGLFSFDKWEKNDIDYFVKAKLEEEGLSPAKEADKATLVRRVCLDIVGLPPTAEQIKKYVTGEGNYEQLVDELLASKQFGERWASMWLDLARYSDSRGYQKDNGRTIWRYRDWVIDAFNANMPFDQFTKEQLAGDLLPSPTKNQLIATAFHRNTMNNDETGTVDEEFRVAAVIDRVNTTFDVWQGTTFACVQCHSHPYDPFRNEEYYKIMAFFNNTRDEDTQDEAPNYREFSDEDEQKLDSLTHWIKSNLGNEKSNYYNKLVRNLEPRHHAHYADNYVNGALLGDRNIGLRHTGTCRLPGIKLDNKTTFLISYANKNVGGWLELRKGSPTGEILTKLKLDTTARNKLLFIPIKATKGRHDLYLVGTNSRLKPEQDVFSINWFTFLEDFPKGEPKKFDDFKYLLTAKTQNTPIMLKSDDDYERKTHVFERGNWLVHGKEVYPDVPRSMNPFPNGAPRNRLGLAEWLLDKDNPLTARTMVNRFWEQLFGIGLVETLEDFGTQGSKPSHTALLDFLAIKFRADYKWQMKPLIKYMLMSATYQQASVGSEGLAAKDPQNRLLAHGPRIRMNSEMVRDQALAVSGLLSTKMYGKPVMPYQPDGVWQAVNSNLNYKQSEGEDQYRRAIYTFARRTGPYPQQITFDAPSREICTQRRIRTNTPLQALQLLNDPVFVEASKSIAIQMQHNASTIDEQINWAYRRIFIHDAPKPDREALKRLYQVSLEEFKAKPQNSKAFLKEEKQQAETAALTIVANAIMNLDEFVTKQ